jgi:hypothetical protein
MLIVFAALMSVAALFLVAYPVLSMKRSSQEVEAPAEEQLDELLGRRDAAFQALRDLSFDHEVGKITDEDFVVFEAGLRQNAAESLRALDRWEANADLNADIALEQAIAARAHAIAGGRRCSQCGNPAAPDDKFCSVCGANLPVASTAGAAVAVCPRCGRPFEAEDRFCAGCGQALSQPVGSVAA